MFTRMMGALTGGPDAGGAPPPDRGPATAGAGAGTPPATPSVTRGGVRVDTVAAVRGALYHTPAAHAAAQDLVYLSAVATVERRAPGGWHLTVTDGEPTGGDSPTSPPSSSPNAGSGGGGGGGGGTHPALDARATWPLDAAALQLTTSRDGTQLAWSDAAAAPTGAAPPSSSGRWAFDVDPADAAAAPTFVALLARGLALHGDADATMTAEALLAEVSPARAPAAAPASVNAASAGEMVRVQPAPAPVNDGVGWGEGEGAAAAASTLYPSVAEYALTGRNDGATSEPAAAAAESAAAPAVVDGGDGGRPGDGAADGGHAGPGAEAEAAAGPVPPLLPPTPGERARAGGDLFKYDVPNAAFARAAAGVLATLALKAADDEDDDEEEDGEGAAADPGGGSGHPEGFPPTFAINLYMDDSGRPFFSQTLSREMNLQFSAGQRSLVWVLPAAEVVNAMPSALVAEPVCLSFRISEVEAFVRFRDAYAEAEYESSSAGDAWADLSAAERSYVVDSVRDDVEMAIDDDDDVDADDDRSLGDAGPGTAMDVDADEEENNLLAVASTIDRSFVARGSRMGVFRTSDDGERQLALATMVEFTKAGGAGGARTPFKPSSMMLHQADSSLLVLDESDPTVVHRMDLERGEVVESWSGGGAAAGVAAAGGRATRSGRSYAAPGAAAAVAPPISVLQRSEKYAHLTGEAGFVGLNARSVLRMDPRDPAFVVQSKTYAARSRGSLTAMATTAAGHVAVASSTGDLRLFDGIGKRAKTLLPGLGDPITAVDVTADGRWLLATTATYLLLLDTRVGGGRGETKGAFEKSLGDRKPTPRQLRLHPADVVAEGMGDISFTAARFNMGDGVERSIVTSTGPFVVTWNFRQVKAGRARAYSIRRYEDKVVADDFAFNDDGKIVVALPNNVSLTAYHR